MNENAEQIYLTICSALDSMKWKYEADPDDATVTFSAIGNDLTMFCILSVEESSELTTLTSRIPITVNEENRTEMILAINIINSHLLNGYFFVQDDSLMFYLVNSYKGSIVTKALFEYMIVTSLRTIDEYNEKLLLVNIGKLNAKDFE